MKWLGKKWSQREFLPGLIAPSILDKSRAGSWNAGSPPRSETVDCPCCIYGPAFLLNLTARLVPHVVREEFIRLRIVVPEQSIMAADTVAEICEYSRQLEMDNTLIPCDGCAVRWPWAIVGIKFWNHQS